MTAKRGKCYLDKLSSKQHFLTIRKGQYWGFLVDLRCSYCNLSATILKSAILKAPYGRRIEVKS